MAGNASEEAQTTKSAQPRFAAYGCKWGEGAARCFQIDFEALEEGGRVRLLPCPDCFVCPISKEIMKDPVSTVDGLVYDREYIEKWFERLQRKNKALTSPATGLELASKVLMPIIALRRAVEAYLQHRPELKLMASERRSAEKAGQLLLSDLQETKTSATDLQGEVGRLQAEVAGFRRERDENDELRAQIKDLQTLSSSLSTALAAARSQNTALSQSNEACQAALRRQAARKRNYEQTLEIELESQWVEREMMSLLLGGHSKHRCQRILTESASTRPPQACTVLLVDDACGAEPPAL